MLVDKNEMLISILKAFWFFNKQIWFIWVFIILMFIIGFFIKKWSKPK
jgi:hypothetical protein